MFAHVERNVMPPTDTAIRNAKPKRKRPSFLMLVAFFMIKPSGAKLWRLAHRFGGKQKLLAFGVYPTISLAEARIQRETAKKYLADGVEPAVHRKLEKQARVVTGRRRAAKQNAS